MSIDIWYFFAAIGCLVRLFLLIWAEDGFMLLVRGIGVDTPVTNVVESAGGAKTFWTGVFIPFKTYAAW